MHQLKKTAFFSLLAAVLLYSAHAFAGFPNGTVLQVTGNDALYYVINGYAAHIPSIKVFQCMRLDSRRKVMISQEQMQAMPRTAFLIEGGDGRIYRVDGEYKRHVPNLDVFRRLGFNDAEVIHISADMVNCIPKGPPLR